MATTASTPSTRQFGIWRSRIHRECEKCASVDAIYAGVTFHELYVDEERGIARARFHCFVPFREGSSALAMVPLVALEVSMPYDQSQLANGEAQFPFQAPRVEIYKGFEYLPREMRETEAATGAVLLRITALTHWTPSNTLMMILQDFVETVQLNDPQPTAAASEGGASPVGGHAAAGRNGKRLRLRKRDIHGVVYNCQEVDTRTGTLCSVPLLLQSGNVVFLAPPSKPSRATAASHKDDEYIFVNDLVPLKEIARITPQRGKSITFFFKSRNAHCRTLLTRQTEEIIADIQRMIAAVGSKRSREDDSRNGYHRNSGPSHDPNDSGALSHLLSFLTPEQTEKAKEVSNKIVGKLSRWGSSVSRFLRGDDEHESAQHHHQQTRHEANDPALREIDQLKAQFFRYPSKAKMIEITNRYQQLAESHAHRGSRDGRVEKAVEELQSFIEHPTSQRVLLEDYAAEAPNRGIRVGPS
ncbi:hypothetical protein Poli38472_005504 [Pythium oligandrum]|uniref:Uncharacterized protein n=1 Tax=Pythium oligandrum TaxID=41045 RepID=A0A8K1CG46_PYTOL|nr:hypothetical protein Poli38472_005504 [Pythium oligandrum]|eukprot:TMW62886.1 hypothetical protein Poli38472_005504 [Pythium oligandrum]